MAAENSMSDDELRSRLLFYGQKVGPVTSTTREVYLRKLKVLQSSRGRSGPLKPSSNRRHLGGFSSDESDAEEKKSGWTSGSKMTSKSPGYDVNPRLGESFELSHRGGRTAAGANDLSYGGSASRVADGEEFARGRASLGSSGLCRPSINGVGKSYPAPMRNMSGSESESFRIRGNNSEYRASSTDPYRHDFASGFNFSAGSDHEYTPPTGGAVPRKSFSGRLHPNRDEATSPSSDASFPNPAFSPPKTKSKSGGQAVGRWQHVSMLLFALGMGFFVLLAYIYWDMTSSNRDIRNNLLLCPKDEVDDNSFVDCVPRASELFVLGLTRQLIDFVSSRAGAFDCGYEASRNVSLKDCNRFLDHEGRGYTLTKPQIKTLILRLFVQNPHWAIRLYDSDGAETDDPTRVGHLVSEKSQMSAWCRFRMSATRVVGAVVTFVAVCAAAFFCYTSVRFWMKRKEEETKEVVRLVERILDKLRQHTDSCQLHSDLKPYLAIAHVRDELIPLQDRCKMQRVWDKAVQFIEAHESRVRTESQMIEAEEFIVWRWVSPSTDVAKVWQGQAFGEHGTRIQCYPPLTTCLKIRNMFDADVEYGDDWHVSIEDAILDKCGANHGILHVAVDRASRDGCVFVRCRDLDCVGRAFKALHGWWFDGKLVTVKYLREQRYFERFPEAIEAVEPVKPSNANRSSLSQPYHASVIENS